VIDGWCRSSRLPIEKPGASLDSREFIPFDGPERMDRKGLRSGLRSGLPYVVFNRWLVMWDLG